MEDRGEKQTQITDDFSEDDKIVSDLKLWDYKTENATLLGIVKNIVEDGTYGKEIVVDTAEEEGITIPSLTALNTKLKNVVIGDKVKIVSLGIVRGKNKRDYYDFDVFIKKP